MTTLLGFDTTAAHCAAVLVSGDGDTLRLVAARGEAMTKGQAERLFPMVEELLAEAGTAWSDLSAIACGIGPGNFTGVRVGVSAARGLALSLGVPAFGVSTFEVMLREGGGAGRHVLVSLPAPKGRAVVQPFDGGSPVGEARMIDVEDPPRDLQAPTGMTVLGHEAETIARGYEADAMQRPAPTLGAEDWENPAWAIASIAHARLARGDVPDRPIPLYVRPPDAAPPKAMPPPIVP